jgi:hypothetical protein
LGCLSWPGMRLSWAAAMAALDPGCLLIPAIAHLLGAIGRNRS